MLNIENHFYTASQGQQGVSSVQTPSEVVSNRIKQKSGVIPYVHVPVQTGGVLPC